MDDLSDIIGLGEGDEGDDKTAFPGAMSASALLPGYAELHCLSNFSFLRGASHPQELAAAALEHGYTALAITDECSLAGVVRAHAAIKDIEAKARADAEAAQLAGEPPPKKQDLKLIIGSELHLTDADGAPFCTLIALATNRAGYGNLSELISQARARSPKGSYKIGPEDFTDPAASSNAADLRGDIAHLKHLPDCILILVPQRSATLADTLDRAHWLAGFAADRAWLALELWQDGSDDERLASCRVIAEASGLPLVAASGALMHARSRKPLQDTLTAIRLNRPLAECGYALEANAERHLRTRLRIGALYPKEAIRQTLKVAACCTFSLDELKYEYPEELVPPGETPASYLRKRVIAGALQRWPNGMDAETIGLIEKELALIARLEYEKYFLTVYDIVSFARSQNILCQGRGSAANSIVCYCLFITELDPVRMGLLIERFISQARNEPPDIDVDFEHQRREEVIQYIYRKYGRHRASLAASLITYHTRSALKDVGKALGLDASLIERIGKSQQWWDGPSAVAGYLREAGFSDDSHVTKHLIRLTRELRGFPRHLSQHVGGFVIARERLSRLVPIENAAMKDRCVIQWDKDDIDQLKLLKVDVLALGMLSAIRRALEFVALRRGVPGFGVSHIRREDKAVYEMCCRADTIGVFQIESRAQQSMLPRLRPQKYYDLVIEVAIVRPGPIQGGMVHPYLRRKQGLEDEEYPKEELRPVLGRTLGVPIFQEQVMKLAMVAAGYTAEQADQLRRAMAAWRRGSHLEKYQADLMKKMLARGYEHDFAARVCKQIEGFGEYGFPESHSASFALLVYISAWIKRYEPAAFLAGLLNSQPLGFYSPSQLVQDARRHGVPVFAPDVSLSDWESVLEARSGDGERVVFDAGKERRRQQFYGAAASDRVFRKTVRRAARRLRKRVELDGRQYGAKGPGVRIGLQLIKGLPQAAAERIMAARVQAPFVDVDDLTRRAALSRRELEALAAGNALASIAGHRRQAWWAVTAQQRAPELLRDAPMSETPLLLPEASEGREIVDDYASLGLTLNRHPLALLRDKLSRLRFKTAAELADIRNGRFVRACGIVTVRQRPGTANGTIFVSIEDETGAINVIVWPGLVEKQRKVLLGASLLGVHGVWQMEGEVRHLVAQRLEDHSALLGRLAAPSRDFH
ncbi:error-prone DNA polymerase [Caballeronia novacaledonica]|uniref:error-prone DNA polymerase n=1 Tax=Caballeronia novacaledonica TaxID=1544861 RepID=UPI001EE1D3F0|nr:error-prone DNA polymerase [Caballeronia novacaledonica]GJH11665.1 error-prone DNA polymerase [Caballeronia novacaledonica]